MINLFGPEIWCQLDSLRFVIERNPGSIVILVGVIAFLFQRLLKFIIDGLLAIYRLAPASKETKTALGYCKTKPTKHDQIACAEAVIDVRVEKARSRISWILNFFLNFIAVALITVAACICYLIFYPPLSCSVPGESQIFVPAVFKNIYSKDGELLYVDEANKSYLRIWPGSNSGRSQMTKRDLRAWYEEKKADALRHIGPGTKFETDSPPSRENGYFVLNWRERDNFDVYFVSRLTWHGDGKPRIDSFEISSPTHGSALMSFDYNVLFCNFIRPSTAIPPEGCERFWYNSTAGAVTKTNRNPVRRTE